MSLLKKSLNDTVFYTIATASGKVASLLIIPFLNTLLSVEKFGEYDLFLIASSFTILIIGFGIDSGFSILISENKDNKKLLGYLFTKSLLISVSALIFLTVLGYVINLYNYFFNFYILFLLVLYVMFSYITYAVFNFIRWIGNAKMAALINFVSSVSGILFGIALLYFYERVIESLFLGMVIGSFLGTVLSLVIVKEYLIFRNVEGGKKKLKELFKISIPFVPTYLSNSFSAFTDRFIILSFIGDIYFIGLYALLYRVSQIGSLAVTIISKGFLPVMYQNYESEDGREFNKKVFDLFVISLIPIFIFIILSKEILIKLLGGANSQDYLIYAHLLPSIFLSSVIFSGMAINGFGFTIKRKTIYVSFISIFGVLINFIISYIFVPTYGFPIIITSTILSSIISASIYTIMSEKLFKFNYNLKIMGAIYLILFVISQIFIYKN